MILKKNLSVGLYILVFIVVYFTFLILTHSIPLEYSLPIFQLIGFGLIILGFFYFFLKLLNERENKKILEFNSLTENTIVLMLIILMMITFFIPPVSFSDMIIDWTQISILNYIRGITFLIGICFVPGSCIYNILFFDNKLHQKLDIESFFFKIILYPIISISFLGTITLIYDSVGLPRDFFPIALFLSILGLYFVAMGVYKNRKEDMMVFKLTKICISKYTGFILFLAACVILIAFGLHTHTLYLQENDGYVVIREAAFIGKQDFDVNDSYPSYWAFISFGLNALTGLPAININAMLFPFLYLFICSLYLLIRIFFTSKDNVHAILATMFAITFSSLYYIFLSFNPHERISLFIFDGLFNFRYKSFSLILFLVSSLLFITSVSKVSTKEDRTLRKDLIYKISLISSFLLFQSFIIYYLPVISFILLILIYFLFSNKKVNFLKILIIFFINFFIFFLVLDIISQFLFSSTLLSVLNYFRNIFPIFITFFNQLDELLPIFIYLSFIGILLSMLSLYWLFKRYKIKKINIKTSPILNKKNAYYLIFSIISLLTILEVILNIIRTLRSLYTFTLFLDLIFFNIGIIGIIGLFSLKQTFKSNKKMLYILSFWFITIFLVAMIGFFINAVKYPDLTPLEWTGSIYQRWINVWFDRIWYYSIIPLSIFASIGIITFLRNLKSIKLFNWRLRLKSRSFIAIFCSLLIFFSLSNTILSGIAFQNQRSNNLIDEEAQITGWVSENIEPGSMIIVDRTQLGKYLGLISATRTILMSNPEIIESINYQNYDYTVNQSLNSACSLHYHDKIELYERVVEFNDTNNNGQILIKVIFSKKIEFGSFDFFLKTSNSSNGWGLNISRSGNLNSLSLYINSSYLYALNDSMFHQISSIEDNKWYSFKIDFEGTNSNYSGLTQYQWKVSINNTIIGPFNYGNNVTYLDQLNLFTFISDADWNVYISQFSFSGDSEFRLEYLLFKYLRLFDYLTNLNYQYLILSINPTEHQLELEQYIDIKNTLITKLYKKQLYAYKTLIIYSI